MSSSVYKIGEKREENQIFVGIFALFGLDFEEF
jgi:hypothetical protein